MIGSIVFGPSQSGTSSLSQKASEKLLKPAASPAPKIVKISIRGGVVHCDSLPAGVTLQVTDYDVYPGATDERDELGEACSRWTVERQAA